LHREDRADFRIHLLDRHYGVTERFESVRLGETLIYGKA
jgi:hypothetical protein